MFSANSSDCKCFCCCGWYSYHKEGGKKSTPIVAQQSAFPMMQPPTIRPNYAGVIKSNGTMSLYLDSNVNAKIIGVVVDKTNLVAVNITPNYLTVGQNIITVTLNTLPQGLTPNNVIYQTIMIIQYNNQTFTITIPTYYIP
ncbi:DUF973 family protein [Sulfurisphaera javensis]